MIVAQPSYNSNLQVAVHRNIESEENMINNYFYPKKPFFSNLETTYLLWNFNSKLFDFDIDLLKFLSTNNILGEYHNLINQINGYFTGCKVKTELEDGNSNLFIIIQTGLSTQEAFLKLVEMRRNSSILKSEKLKKLISITTESL